MPTIQSKTNVAVPRPCVRPMATAGTALAMEPKMGTSEKTAATIAITGQYLSPMKANPMALRTPLMLQMTSCPRTTPESPRSMRASSESNRVPASSPTRDLKNPRMRSRVIIMYAASIRVMKKMKMTRLTATKRSRTARAISSEFACA